ncbi:hypothetical protein FKG94_06920 [Exilibacterium tricleocarpae]|uniref:Uncharacterized protein n=1 Tax=Exilibacterium tricleocarpae TaxID=2591008 RepID=A0A545TZ26_9GAMM|nr:hypothetical protein [Exilibacterium tricleocarpae]TQV82468.1 hypothetical protein FKG94_06920 [Exilibacterium tricleocarpae]
MRVISVLDIENGIDPEFLLGDLIIEDKKGKAIILNCTYVDAWLMSFCDYLTSDGKIQTGDIYIAEEPDRFRVQVSEESLSLSYKDIKIVVSLHEFVASLTKELTSLINICCRASGEKGEDVIYRLQRKVSALKSRFKYV